ncbi:MAG: hypothetical protein HY901_12290 [Deltaproteobacteria bacterium]|nr:hypothetical protein [Deltaproteobacteria bacterium]
MSLRSNILLLALIAVFAGCAQDESGTPPPIDDFYYPVSVAVVEQTPGKPILYVVSSNFDLRYNRGTVIAVDTAKLSDPPDGPIAAAVDQERGWAFIDSYGGETATFSPAGAGVSGETRLFVPTRFENRLFALSADGPQLSCLLDRKDQAEKSIRQDCQDQGILLEDPDDEAVRSVDPFGVALDGSSLFITHLSQADDPPQSGEKRTSYLVHLDAETLTSPPAFLDIGPAPASTLVRSPVGLYIAGRSLAGTELGNSEVLRQVVPTGSVCITCARGETACGASCCAAGQTCSAGTCVVKTCNDGQTACGASCCAVGELCAHGTCLAACPEGQTACGALCCAENQTCDQDSGTCFETTCPTGGGACMGNQCRNVVDTAVTNATSIEEARGLALSSDQSRLFLSTRSPDGLLVVDVTVDPSTGAARNRVLGFSTLPTGPSQVLVIPRTGMRDLVAIACTTSNAVAFYDDELGEATGLVEGIAEPFGMAKATIAGKPDAARLFVASFGNHTVDVIDVSDVARPRTAVLVGQLGLGAHRPLGIVIPEGLQ